jgi:hypothetical protein
VCNLYSQTRNVEAIRRLFRISDNRANRIDPQPAIFPGWTAPVIRKAEDCERELLPNSRIAAHYHHLILRTKHHLRRTAANFSGGGIGGPPAGKL